MDLSYAITPLRNACASDYTRRGNVQTKLDTVKEIKEQ